VSISVETINNGFLEVLAQATTLGVKDFQPELALFGHELLFEISHEFDAGVTPYGEKWQPLAPATVEVKHSSQVLVETGELRRSFGFELVPTGLSVFTDRIFPDGVTAEIHQFGGIHPRANNFIPAREMLPFRDILPVVWESHTEIFLNVGLDRLFP
jgi:phage gpG-like protein